MAYLIADPSDEIYAGSRLTVQANGLTYSSDNDYYEIRVYVDGDIQYTSEITYDREVYTKTYSIPSRASDTVNIQLHQWVSGLGYVKRDAISIDVIADSEESGGSSSGGGSTIIYNPTIGSFDLTPINSSGGTTSIAVQGKTRIQASVSGCTAGSGYISSYTFTSPSGSYNTSSTYNVFSSPSGSGWFTYGVYVYNSAGGSTYTSKQIYVYPYSAPYFTKFNAYRSNSSGTADVNGEYITYEYQIGYSSVNNTNSITVNIYCNGSNIKQASGTSGKYTTTSTHSIDEQHNLYAIVTDTYGANIKSAIENIYPSGKILNIAADGQSIGIGGLAPDIPATLSCYWNMIVSTLNGRQLPEIEIGKVSVGGGSTPIAITYSKPFSGYPCLYMIPQYPYLDIQTSTWSSGPRNFSCTITTTWGGNWDVYWIAIYVP